MVVEHKYKAPRVPRNMKEYDADLFYENGTEREDYVFTDKDAIMQRLSDILDSSDHTMLKIKTCDGGWFSPANVRFSYIYDRRNNE